jgi:hypothetical protein
MLGQIVLGVALMGVSLLYFRFGRDWKLSSRAQAWQQLPSREKPFAPAPLPGAEWVFLIVIGIGLLLIVSAIV